MPNDYTRWLQERVRGKTVLDVGAVEHAANRYLRDDWKHRIICGVADRCVGVDVLAEEVERIRALGYELLVCDATSNEFLGERFDVIYAGDVIEHVDSPVALLRFCARHLKPNGAVFVRTPNPHCFDYLHTVKRRGTDVSNLEHVSYISPVHMLELARRSGLNLVRYYSLTPEGVTLRGCLRAARHILKTFSFRHAFAELVRKPETFSTIFVYELTL